MDLYLLGITASLIGKLCLAFAVFSAHMTMERAHKIDQSVIKSFEREKIMTVIGVILLLLGYFLEVQFFGGFEHLWTCEAGVSCLWGG